MRLTGIVKSNRFLDSDKYISDYYIVKLDVLSQL